MNGRRDDSFTAQGPLDASAEITVDALQAKPNASTQIGPEKWCPLNKLIEKLTAYRVLAWKAAVTELLRYCANGLGFGSGVQRSIKSTLRGTAAKAGNIIGVVSKVIPS